MQEANAVPQREMPRYRSHKTVWALKIADIQQSPADELSTADGGTWRLIPVNLGYGPITVPHSYIVKHAPQPGGYYVVYADGYASFSPAAAFEEGYTADGPVLRDGSPADPDKFGTVTIDSAIKAAGADRAPRVTPADIEAEITHEFYFKAPRAMEDDDSREVWHTDKGAAPGEAPLPQALHLLTFCVLVLRNGFTVTGQSACASPENFNAEIGRRVAREDAVRQVWPLLGFRLRDKLVATPADFRDRVREEKRDLDEKIAKLSAFLVTKQFGALSFLEQTNLHAQHVAMTTYSIALKQRIATFAPVQPA